MAKAPRSTAGAGDSVELRDQVLEAVAGVVGERYHVQLDEVAERIAEQLDARGVAGVSIEAVSDILFNCTREALEIPFQLERKAVHPSVKVEAEGDAHGTYKKFGRVFYIGRMMDHPSPPVVDFGAMWKLQVFLDEQACLYRQLDLGNDGNAGGLAPQARDGDTGLGETEFFDTLVTEHASALCGLSATELQRHGVSELQQPRRQRNRYAWTRLQALRSGGQLAAPGLGWWVRAQEQVRQGMLTDAERAREDNAPENRLAQLMTRLATLEDETHRHTRLRLAEMAQLRDKIDLLSTEMSAKAKPRTGEGAARVPIARACSSCVQAHRNRALRSLQAGSRPGQGHFAAADIRVAAALLHGRDNARERERWDRAACYWPCDQA